LETARAVSIRFYRWQSSALSFGYFGRFADVAHYALQRDLVRRWTGGGIVFHGEDLTYSIIIPATEPAFGESPKSIYEKIHCALRDALTANDGRVELAAMGRDAALRRPRKAQRAVPTNVCFANPVSADVMVNGQKVAGAAQRRTRSGLLHQGSIQHVDLGNGFAERFAKELSNNCETGDLPEAVHDRAQEGYVVYAIGSRGKRLRPLLALLAGGATGKISLNHVDLAVIVELIHIATLVHDDVMDEAERRRAQPTANARWGNSLSVLLGDCLFAHALTLSTNFENADISRAIARTAGTVCSGEM